MLGQGLNDSGLRGTVLNTGSVLGHSPSPEFFGTIAYAARKGAVRSLTLAAAARYARDRIRFSLLSPGLIDTPMAVRAVDDPRVSAYLERKQAIAGGPGSAEDGARGGAFPLRALLAVRDGGGTDGRRRLVRFRRRVPCSRTRTGRRMNDRGDVLDQYLGAVRAAVDAIEATQLGAVREASARFARAILAGRLVHVFGTGHSRMAVEEMWPRYGSFPGFNPIVELSMTFHNPVVGANGQRQAMFLENVQGFGPVLWRNFATSPDDCLLAVSTSGCNAVTIDVAIEAKRRGMSVVALTSLDHARVSRSKHESGKKLFEVANLVLDHQSPPGDSAVWVEGLETPVSPVSSVSGCTVINLVKAEVARLLTEAGQPPKVLTAACHLGADRARELFEETYDDYRRARVGVLYSLEAGDGTESAPSMPRLPPVAGDAGLYARDVVVHGIELDAVGSRRRGRGWSSSP